MRTKFRLYKKFLYPLYKKVLYLCYNKDGFGVLDLEDQVIPGLNQRSTGVWEGWSNGKSISGHIKVIKMTCTHRPGSCRKIIDMIHCILMLVSNYSFVIQDLTLIGEKHGGRVQS